MKLMRLKFILTEEQMQILVNHFSPDSNINDISESIYCEWIDELIDNLV